MAHISVFGLHSAYLLGFERIADVRGIKSIRNLLAKSANDSDKPMSFCGIYLQIRPHGRLYIGQTTNLPARFERHIAQGVIIEELAFKPMDADDLDREEKRLIALAQKHGLTLDNLALRERTRLTLENSPTSLPTKTSSNGSMAMTKPKTRPLFGPSTTPWLRVFVISWT